MNREKVYQNAIFSETGQKNNIINRPNFEQCKNIEHFYVNVVSKLEILFKGKLKINSWFRNSELNNLVGGSKRSIHLQGLAIDFYVENMNIEDVKNKILKNLIEFYKLIIYPDRNFIHIEYDFEKVNKRLLYKKMNGKCYERI